MSRVSLSVKHARALWGLLPNVADVSPDERMAMAALEAALKPRPVSSQRKKTAAKRRTRKAETSAIYEEVAKRAGGKCEACRGGFSAFAYSVNRPELDHFYGRGRSADVASCWMLCATCHHHKTNNRPDAGYWLRTFFSHCIAHGYSAEAEKARARLEGIVQLRLGGGR
jgi:hypothetical protein